MPKTLTLFALAILGLLFAGYCSATTTVSFGAASSCPTYCTGFTTDNPAYTLGWLNAAYALSSPQHTLLAVNGVTYSGNTVATFIAQVGTHNQYQVYGTLAQQGGTAKLTVTYTLEYWTTRVVSGRDAGHIVQHRMIDGGTLGL